MSILVLLSALLSAKGPEGKTAEEICKSVVGQDKSSTCVDDPSYREVVETLNKIQTGVESARSPKGKRLVTLSNAAFVSKSLQFREKFGSDFAMFYGDTVMRTLFNTSAAFNSINAWANRATDGLIPQYLKSQDELSPDTLMMLLNAFTFTGKLYSFFS